MFMPAKHDEASVARARETAKSRLASGLDPFDVIESSPHADQEDDWDSQGAQSLASFYEPGHSGYVSNASATAASQPRGSSTPDHGLTFDQAWLENRFTEIAKGIDRSLSDMRPDHGFYAIGQRLDQFEQQFQKMFENVATKADLESVRLIEAHVGSVVDHLAETHDQLARLNVIEKQLAEVTHTFAEAQSGATADAQAGAVAKTVPAIDIDAVARAAADQAAQRFAGQQGGELRPLIEQMISETGRRDENTAALLDTLRQAMIRLLDRVEALDLQQHQAGIAPAAPEAQVKEESPAAAPPAHPEKSDDEVAEFADAPDTGFASAEVVVARRNQQVRSQDDDPSPEAISSKHQKLRQDFIAEAKRAKMRLAASEDEIIITSPASGTFTASSSAETGVGPYALGSRRIKPPAASAKASAPSAPSPRLIAIALAALLALTGLWYSLDRNPGKDSTAPPSHTSDAKNAGSKPSQSDGGKSNAPSSATGEQHGEANPGDGAAQVAPTKSGAVKTALPMLGVAVDLGQPLSEQQFEQARRHQAMANLSGEVGTAAARPGNAPVVPASMVPSEAETEGANAPAGTGDVTGAIPDGAARSSRLDMPAADIGPLSLRLAAANGDPSAEFEVGARLAEGLGVTQNFKEAAKWYQRSADRGFAQAEYRLGTLYERGLGLKPDRARAAAWYQRAAEQGNIKAMHNLAVLSANRSDQSPDYTTAAQWFEAAAKRGLPDSQFNLAVLYENGLGVNRDLKQAFMWLSLAARDGDADAVRRRDTLRGKLTADEIKSAEQMIKAWHPLQYDRNINDARVAGEEWKKNPKNGVSG
jgi:localization factor PodJL